MAAMSGLQQSLLQLLDRLPRLQQDKVLQQACSTQVRSLITSITLTTRPPHVCLHT
jgi:hypothetical protein